MQRALTFTALLLIAAGCRSEPVDTQALLSAHSLGLTNLQRGQLTEAEQQFRKVVDLAPKDATGHANLGLTYLRGARYKEAENELDRARKLNPASVEIGLMLAKLYSLTGRADEARKLLGQLGGGRDARVTYALAEMNAAAGGGRREAGGDTTTQSQYAQRLREVLNADPANMAVRLQLADALARRGLADSAAQQLQEVRRLRPEPPPEAKPHLDSALVLLRANNLAEARTPFDRFLHVMELTAPYQASLEKVKWVEGPLVGRPVLAFNPQTLITTRGLIPVGRRTEISFTDVTAEVGLSESGMSPTALALGDYDGNGSDNLVVSLTSTTGAQRQSAVRAYNILRGYVVDATAKTGIALPSRARYMSFADFDNDGWLDLFAIGGDDRGYLLRNDGTGKFTDVTSAARVADAGGARKALFVDLDHDGDLDLLLVGDPNRVYRNNLDGTFADVSEAMGLRRTSDDAAFADFDGDGRIDVATAFGTGVALFRNTGFQRFEDVTARSGLSAGSTPGAAGARLAVADYDNDGWFDVLSLAGGGVFVWRNQGAHFVRDRQAESALRDIQRASSVQFADYDNDGWLDVFALASGRALLFHNDRGGKFSDQSKLLPSMPARASSVTPTFAINDIDGDGDQDLLVADSAGVHLLRNNGGNANLAMQVQLTGLRTGSGKNNNFGVGSKIEVRAGELYETRVVTDRITHFGLGPHLKADVMRVEWTNGVPQTIYFPGTDQDVLELEQLKGSCAFLYTWDGKQFRFVTDVMWRSALGMPLGIMTGGGSSKAAYAPAGASQEYLRIPGEALQPRNGRYTLQLTEELWETAFLDHVKLLAVDHPDSVEVFVDERFVPPGPVQLRFFQAARRYAPLSATDDRGNNVLAALRDRDDVYVGDFTPTRYQGLVEPHAVVLDLGPDAGRAGTYLFLRGWIYPTDASINVAVSQRKGVGGSTPSLEVRNARGEWQTVVPSLGFPSGKDKTIVIGLSGKFPTNDHRVRIRTNMAIYWDQAFVATDAATNDVRTTTLRPASADLHYRGFSRMYRRGGRNGPHWFAYNDVSKESPWRPIVGNFTRFGDVSHLLDAGDDMYVIMAPGDEATLEFDATSAPPPPKGWKRTFLLYTDGWIKDSDLNTAFGNSVEPLPFHAIEQYPYAPRDSYPADSAHTAYQREFNTRKVGGR